MSYASLFRQMGHVVFRMKLQDSQAINPDISPKRMFSKIIQRSADYFL